MDRNWDEYFDGQVRQFDRDDLKPDEGFLDLLRLFAEEARRRGEPIQFLLYEDRLIIQSP